MIRVRNLVFDYVTGRALDDVSVDVEPGSITALVGPNGAGKTTLMRCMVALDQPFSGSIMLDDINVLAEPRRAHSKIGFLQDIFGLYDKLTVGQCIFHAACARAVPEGEVAQRIEQLSKRLGLENLLNRRAGELSRGQRQRVGIAQAIIHQPRILILDEPASGLDPEARIALSSLLRSLRQDGMTILVSSHILAELEDYSTHMIIMDRGRVVSSSALKPAEGGVRIRITLAAPGNLHAALASVNGLSQLAVNSALEAEFNFTADVATHARLLNHLVTQGLAVCAFAEKKSDLQAEYLENVRHARQSRAAANTEGGQAS